MVRDARAWGIAGGTIEIQLTNIASELFGRRFGHRPPDRRIVELFQLRLRHEFAVFMLRTNSRGLVSLSRFERAEQLCDGN